MHYSSFGNDSLAGDRNQSLRHISKRGTCVAETAAQGQICIHSDVPRRCPLLDEEVSISNDLFIYRTANFCRYES